MSIAIAHGELTSDGGAERVAIQMARCFDAPIYANKVDQSFVPDDIQVYELFDSRWANFFFEQGYKPDTVYWLCKHFYQMQRAQYLEQLYPYETIIQTKAGTDWFIPRDTQTVIRYVHHVQRRHYDQFYLRGRALKERVWSLFHRTMHKQTVDYPDIYVANSDITKRRIERYWGIDSDDIHTVYPGVHIPNEAIKSDADGEYFFHVGRLANNKRIDLLVNVAREIDTKIIVAGTGPLEHLVEDGPSNLEYVGYVDENQKWEYLSNALGTLFLAENEDFGIVPIESMAVGTPVIGVNEGFTQHQIRDEKNGYLCAPTVASVACEICLLENNGVQWSGNTIRDYAAQFSIDRFEEEMRGVVKLAKEDAEIQTHIKTPVGSYQ